MSLSLTQVQQNVLSFVEDFIATNSYSPSTKEVAEHFGWSSPASAQQHIQALEKKGRISRTKNSARSIQILKPLYSETAGSTVHVPMVGKIAAGLPSFALEEAEEVLTFPRSLFRGENLFALRVTGDSMVDVGIFDQDIAVLEARSDFDDGVIAAVVLDEEATLKRVFRTKTGIRLKAENSSYPDRVIRLDKEHISYRLAGVLLGTIRQFAKV